MLTDKDKLLLDAIVTDEKNLDLAYILHRGKKPDATDFSIHRMSLRWVRNKEIAQYLTKRRRGNLGTSDDKQKDRNLSDIIKELNAAINAETDNKKRADLLLRLSDLLRETPDEEKPESRVSYYLPLRCQNCGLYTHFEEVQKKKDPQKRKSIDAAWFSDYVDTMWRKAHGENDPK